MPQLSGCSVMLSQNDKDEFQLTFQSTSSEVLREIMTIIYEQSTLTCDGGEALQRTVQGGSAKMPYRRTSKTRFLIKNQTCFYPITSDQIAYFYALERQVYLKTKKGVVYRMTERIEDIEKAVDPLQFFRINRSMIVSYDSIVEMTYLNNGKLALTTTPAFTNSLYVSKERSNAFKKWLNT